MLNINEINDEIKKLENCDCTSYEICRKLAILYTVRDHYKGVSSNDTISQPVTPQINMTSPSMVK